MADVLAVAESKHGALAGVSRETVTVARSLADSLGGAVDVAVAGASGDVNWPRGAPIASSGSTPEAPLRMVRIPSRPRWPITSVRRGARR